MDANQTARNDSGLRLIAGVEQRQQRAPIRRGAQAQREHGRLRQVKQRPGRGEQLKRGRLTEMLHQRTGVGGLRGQAVGARLVKLSRVRLDDITRRHHAGLRAGEVRLPVVVRHPAEQQGALQRHILLVLGEVKVPKLHHRVFGRGDRHAVLAVVEVHPALDGEIVATRAGELIQVRADRHAADVETRLGGGDVEGEQEVRGLGVNGRAHLPLGLEFDLAAGIGQEHR